MDLRVAIPLRQKLLHSRLNFNVTNTQQYSRVNTPQLEDNDVENQSPITIQTTEPQSCVAKRTNTPVGANRYDATLESLTTATPRKAKEICSEFKAQVSQHMAIGDLNCEEVEDAVSRCIRNSKSKSSSIATLFRELRDTTLRRPLKSTRVLSDIVDCISVNAGDQVIQTEAALLLNDIWCDSKEPLSLPLDTAVFAKAAVAIVCMMLAFANEHQLQSVGSQLLGHWVECSPTCCSDIVRAGGIEALTPKLLQMNSCNDVQLMKTFFKMVRSSAAASEDSQLNIFRSLHKVWLQAINGKDATVQSAGMTFLHHFACNSCAARNEMFNMHTHEPIIRMLNTSTECSDPCHIVLGINTIGAMATANLFQQSASQLDRCANSISDTMARHFEDWRVQSAGCRTLGTLANCSNGYIRTQSILQALRAFSTNARIAENAMFALGNCMCNAAAAADFVREAGLQEICNCVRSHKTAQKVVREGCRALENIASNFANDKSQFGAEYFSAAQCVDFSLEILQHALNSHVEALVQGATAAILSLSYQPLLAQELAEGVAIKLLFRSISENKDVPKIVRDSLGVLHNMQLSGNIADQSPNRIALVIELLGSYVDDHDVTLKLLQCLCDMGADSDLRVVGKFGGLENVLGAMQAFLSSPKIQRAGCAVLAHVAKDQESALRISMSDGVGAVLRTMQAHPNGATLLTEACRTLKGFGKFSPLRALLQDKTCVHALFAAMKRHARNGALIEAACATISALTQSRQSTEILFQNGVVSLLADILDVNLKKRLNAVHHKSAKTAALVAAGKTMCLLFERASAVGLTDVVTQCSKFEFTHSVLDSCISASLLSLRERSLCMTALSLTFQFCGIGSHVSALVEGASTLCHLDTCNRPTRDACVAALRETALCGQEFIDLLNSESVLELAMSVMKLEDQFSESIARNGWEVLLEITKAGKLPANDELLKQVASQMKCTFRQHRTETVLVPALEVASVAFNGHYGELDLTDFHRSLFTAMHSCKKSPQVQELVLNLLHKAAEQDAELFARTACQFGGLGYLVDTAFVHSMLLPLLSDSLKLILVVLAHNPKIVSAVFGICGGVDMVLKCLETHSQCGDVELQALLIDVAIASLDNSANQGQFMRGMMAERITSLIQKHGNTVTLLEKCMQALRYLVNKPRYVQKVFDQAGVQDLFKVLTEHAASSIIQVSGIGIIQRVALSEKAAWLVSSGSIMTILSSAMAAHPADASVQTVAVATVACLSETDDFRSEILSCGILNTILNSLATLPDCVQVHQHALGLFKKLVGTEEGRNGVVASGCLASVIDSVARLRSNDKVQGLGSFVLAHIAQRGTRESQQKIIELGGVAVLVRTLELFSERSKLCRLSCAALGALTKSDASVVSKVLESDGVASLLKVMRHHIENREIQKAACALLGNVASGKGARQQLIEHGATEFVVDIMKRNADNVFVQTVSVAVLRVLCKHSNPQRSELGRLNVIPMTLEAMKVHASNVEFQRNSFHFLRSLALVQENRQMITKLAGVEYVVAAVHAKMTPKLTQHIISSSLSGKSISGKVAAALTAWDSNRDNK